MKFNAKHALIGLIALTALGALAPGGRSLRIPSVALNSLPELQLPSGSDDQPPPCECKCGGKIRCDKGQWAYCECNAGKCDGICTSKIQQPFEIASAVVSIVEGKTVEPASLRMQRGRYSKTLKAVLDSKISEGRYLFRYQDREIGFSFNKQSISKLNTAITQLEEPE